MHYTEEDALKTASKLPVEMRATVTKENSMCYRDWEIVMWEEPPRTSRTYYDGRMKLNGWYVVKDMGVMKEAVDLCGLKCSNNLHQVLKPNHRRRMP